MQIYDLVDPQELQGFIRGIQQEEEQNRFVLRTFLPNDNIDDIEYSITQGSLNDQDAALVRAWDAESPIGSRQGVRRLMGELPPISKKIPLTEEQRLRKRKLEGAPGAVAALENAIFNDAANMARAVLARIEMMRGEALYSGQIVINENGVQQTIDFDRSASHEPAALAGGAMWSATATATPLNDVRGWVATYLATNGFKPGLILTSTAVISNLLLNQQIRDLAAANNITPAFLTEATLMAVFQAYGLPPFVAYDTLVRVDGVQQRVIPDDRVIMLPPATEVPLLGRTFFGTTAEALELAEARQIEAEQAPGMVSVIEKTFDPVSVWTKAVAISLPVLVNPDYTFAVDVQ